VLFSHGLFWANNRFIADQDWARISPSSIRSNFENGWVWDENTFAENHLGHPAQGSLYYTAARSQGVGFWGASLTTAVGSATWELFMETEPPSKNDLAATTLGGIALGEILQRLSQKAFATETRGGAVAGSVLAPVNGANHGLGWNASSDKRQTLMGWVDLGGGASIGRLKVEGAEKDPQEMLLGPSFHVGLALEYGNPFAPLEKPFDSFRVRASLFRLRDKPMFTYFSQGLLAGKVWNHGQRHWLVGAWLHYDCIFNEWVNLGANSIGTGIQWRSFDPAGTGWEWGLQPAMVVMGSSDFLYAQLTVPKGIELADSSSNGVPGAVAPSADEEIRTYQLSLGENLKGYLNLVRVGWGRLGLSYTIYGLHTFPGSEPYSGSKGYDVIGVGMVRLSRPLGRHWGVALEGYLYHKEAYYDTWPDLDERIGRLQLVGSRYF